MLKVWRYLVLLSCLSVISVGHARDVIIEFKGAGFFPTSSRFKNIYGTASALFGPEVTFRLCDDINLYGFASIDFLHKKGCSVGLGDVTKVTLVPFAFGLKYLQPVWEHTDYSADFYVGLGFEPVYIKTTNESEYALPQQSQWGFGGIAKVGTFFTVPHNVVIDLFLDYSFAYASAQDPVQLVTGTTTPVKSNVSGVIFGAALGYRF